MGARYRIKISDGRTPTWRGSHPPPGALIIYCDVPGHEPFTPYYEDDRPAHAFHAAMLSYSQEKRARLLAAAIAYRDLHPEDKQWHHITKYLADSDGLFYACPAASFQYAVGTAPENLEPQQRGPIPAGSVFALCGVPGHGLIAAGSIPPYPKEKEILCRISLLKVSEAFTFALGRSSDDWIEAATRVFGQQPACPDEGTYSITRASEGDSAENGIRLKRGEPVVRCSKHRRIRFAIGKDGRPRGLAAF